MNRNTLLIIVVGVLLVFTLMTVFSSNEESTDEPTDSNPENATETETEEEIQDITIENFKLNGEDGTVTLTTDDPSVITATLINETEEEIEVELRVVQNGRAFDDRHSIKYTVAPGETQEIEEVREEHKTWYPGEFTVELGDQAIAVTVK